MVHKARLHKIGQGERVILTVLAHVGVQVLLGAELVCELLWAEGLLVRTLLCWLMGADKHLCVVYHGRSE